MLFLYINPDNDIGIEALGIVEQLLEAEKEEEYSYEGYQHQ